MCSAFWTRGRVATRRTRQSLPTPGPPYPTATALPLAPSVRRETGKDEPRTRGAFIQWLSFRPGAVMRGVGVLAHETNNSDAER